MHSLSRSVPAQVLASAYAGVAGQSYPSNPVRLMVAFAAGGGTDVLARMVANTLKDKVGQTLIVENRPGAGTIIGTEAAASGNDTLFLPDLITKSTAGGAAPPAVLQTSRRCYGHRC